MVFKSSFLLLISFLSLISFKISLTNSSSLTTLVLLFFLTIGSFDKNYKGKFHKEILSAISKGVCRKKDIANCINQNLVITNNNLCWLKKHNLIFPKEKFITNKGAFFLYGLTEEGKKFLIKKSNSFFD